MFSHQALSLAEQHNLSEAAERLRRHMHGTSRVSREPALVFVSVRVSLIVCVCGNEGDGKSSSDYTEKASELAAMGFDMQAALQALALTQGDIESAIPLLV